jgi:hypothetical protein
MTTKVVVTTEAGWPVDVTLFIPNDPTAVLVKAQIPANTAQSFYIHSTQSVMLEEVQPQTTSELIKHEHFDIKS